MKKIILLVLAFLLIFSVTIPCFALENSELQDMIAEKLSTEMNCQIKPENIQINQNDLLSNGYVLFDYQIVGIDDLSMTCYYAEYMMGDYVFKTGSGDNKCIFDGKNIYGIVDAYYRRIIDEELISEIAPLYPAHRINYEDGQVWVSFGFMKVEDYPEEDLPYVNKIDYFLGDADMDGVTTVMDATAIQKVKANLKSEDEINSKTADYDGDGVISVIDATGIQKHLAGME